MYISASWNTLVRRAFGTRIGSIRRTKVDYRSGAGTAASGETGRFPRRRVAAGQPLLPAAPRSERLSVAAGQPPPPGAEGEEGLAGATGPAHRTIAAGDEAGTSRSPAPST